MLKDHATRVVDSGSDSGRETPSTSSPMDINDDKTSSADKTSPADSGASSSPASSRGHLQGSLNVGRDLKLTCHGSAPPSTAPPAGTSRNVASASGKGLPATGKSGRDKAVHGDGGNAGQPTAFRPGRLTPLEILERLYPYQRRAVLELVLQGCNGDLVKAIEHFLRSLLRVPTGEAWHGGGRKVRIGQQADLRGAEVGFTPLSAAAAAAVGGNGLHSAFSPHLSSLSAALPGLHTADALRSSLLQHHTTGQFLPHAAHHPSVLHHYPGLASATDLLSATPTHLAYAGFGSLGLGPTLPGMLTPPYAFHPYRLPLGRLSSTPLRHARRTKTVTGRSSPILINIAFELLRPGTHPAARKEADVRKSAGNAGIFDQPPIQSALQLLTRTQPCHPVIISRRTATRCLSSHAVQPSRKADGLRRRFSLHPWSTNFTELHQLRFQVRFDKSSRRVFRRLLGYRACCFLPLSGAHVRDKRSPCRRNCLGGTKRVQTLAGQPVAEAELEETRGGAHVQQKGEKVSGTEGQSESEAGGE
ncbi:hypothetical protein C0Q70_16826 [Pomacea canaliculata]|uniref:DMA domain-containing protein n=1 Tax=Pomacea canaliculata TaxID=400727 RepID=A0A2T7NQV1_POMCA|nr:hypothetical protein C0Q70_16826 [Pomacea canaliculata]